MPTLTLGTAYFGQLPIASFYNNEYFRNRAATVNMPTGASATTEYMIVDTRNVSSPCCGAYGNEEATVADSGSGHMFALAFSTGAAGTFGTGSGPWPGVDWENGVYLYGSNATSTFETILAKYSPTGPTWALEEGPVSQNSLITLHSGTPPFTADFEGGLSLGEGGDGSAAPINFIEGAILASTTTGAADAALQQSIQNFYGSASVNQFSMPNCGQNIAANLVSGSFNFASGWTTNGATVSNTIDPFGVLDAASVVNGGHNYASIYASVTLAANTQYTYIDYVQATNGASAFPCGGVTTNETGSSEFGWCVNTNTGQILPSTWTTGTAAGITQSSSAFFNGWWQIKTTFITAGSTTSGNFYLNAPTVNSLGVRTYFSNGLTAVHFCPMLVPTASEIDGGGANTSGTVKFPAAVITGGYTVSTLPSGVLGMKAYVTDQTSACPAPGGVLAGSGSVTCPVFYNGAAWVGD